MRVFLHRADLERMRAHAMAHPTEEVCGLLGGFDTEDGCRHVERVLILENVEHSRVHFSIDQREHLQAVRALRGEGLSPVGNWHSHPDTPSRQSAEDIRLSADSTASYMILSLQEREHPVLRSFHCEGGVSTAEELILID